MKYAIGFLGAFIVVGALVAFLRFGAEDPAGDTPEAEPSPQAHDHGNEHEDHSDHAEHGDNSDPAWGGEVKLDLKNRVDPVSGDAVGEDHDAHHHQVYHGFLVHLADEDSAARFRRGPVRYLAKLELEPTADGEVVKVDASSYETPELPDECPFCGMTMDETSDIYILHRNFKIFFG